jgi:hypothetical protein
MQLKIQVVGLVVSCQRDMRLSLTTDSFFHLRQQFLWAIIPTITDDVAWFGIHIWNIRHEK